MRTGSPAKSAITFKPRLESIQDLFANALSDDSALEQFATMVNASSGTSARNRILLYRRNVIGGRIRALNQIFPVCRKLVGEKYFAQIARSYIESHVSRNQDLSFYGVLFSTFVEDLVAQRPEVRELVYLSDLTRLEWCLHESYYGRDEAPFDFNAFEKVKPGDYGDVSFVLSDSVRLLSSSYPISQIWNFHQGAESLRAPDLCEGPEYLLIHRREFTPRIESLDAPVWEYLSALASGARLTEAVEMVSADERLPPLEALIQLGYVVGFRLESNERRSKDDF